MNQMTSHFKGREMIRAKLVCEGGFSFVEFTEGELRVRVRLYHNTSYEIPLTAFGREFIYKAFPISTPTLYELVSVPLEIEGKENDKTDTPIIEVGQRQPVL